MHERIQGVRSLFTIIPRLSTKRECVMMRPREESEGRKYAVYCQPTGNMDIVITCHSIQ